MGLLFRDLGPVTVLLSYDLRRTFPCGQGSTSGRLLRDDRLRGSRGLVLFLLLLLVQGAPWISFAGEAGPDAGSPDLFPFATAAIRFDSPNNPTHGYCEPNPRLFTPVKPFVGATPPTELDHSKGMSMFQSLSFGMEKARERTGPSRKKKKPNPFAPNQVPEPEPVPGKRFLLDNSGKMVECQILPVRGGFKVYDMEGTLCGWASVGTFTIYDFPGVLPAGKAMPPGTDDRSWEIPEKP